MGREELERQRTCRQTEMLAKASALRDTLLVAMVAAILSILFLGSRPFSTRGEPREALVAQSMINSGEWVLGSGYGGVVPSKPPLMHWGIALFSVVSGEVNEWTARLPSAGASVLFALFWFRFLLVRVGRDHALLSTLLLLTSVEWYRAATACRVDMVLAVLLVVALLAIFSWWERGLRGFPVFGLLALVGATLTKGPVALALPGCIFLIFLLLKREQLPRILWRALVLFVPALLGALLWYVIAYVERGPEFFQKFYYENIARLAGSQEDAPHKNSALYLYATLLLGFLPWTLLALPNLVGFGKWIASGPKRWYAWVNGLTSFGQFSLIAAGAFILFFSLVSGKRSVYLLPIYPFLAYALAHTLLVSEYHVRCWSRGLVRLLAGAVATLGILITLFVYLSEQLGFYHNFLESSDSQTALKSILVGLVSGNLIGPTVCYYLLIIAALYGVFSTRRVLRDSRSLTFFLSALFALAAGSVLAFGAHEMSGKEFARQADKLLPPGVSLYSFDNEFYGVSFYLNREIKRIPAEPEEGAYLFLYDKDISDFKSAYPGINLKQIFHWPKSVDKLGRTVSLMQIEKA